MEKTRGRPARRSSTGGRDAPREFARRLAVALLGPRTVFVKTGKGAAVAAERKPGKKKG